MKSSKINIGGINRKVAPHSSTGMAEELINIRYMSDGLEIVRAKQTVNNLIASRIWEHHIGDETVLIGTAYNDDNNLCYYAYNTDDGYEPFYEFLSSEAELSIASIGNILVFSCKEELWNRAFRYDGGTYTEMDLSRPEKKVKLSFGNAKTFSSRIYAEKDALDSEKASAVQSAFNVIQNENKEYLFGDMLYAFCYKYAGGQEDWSFGWMPRLEQSLYREIELRIKYAGDTSGVWEDASSREVSKLHNLLIKGYKVTASLSDNGDTPSEDVWTPVTKQSTITVFNTTSNQEQTISLAEPLYLLNAMFTVTEVNDDGSVNNNFTSGVYVVDNTSSTSSFYVLDTIGGLPAYSEEGFSMYWFEETDNVKRLFSDNGYELSYDTDSGEWRYRIASTSSDSDSSQASTGSEELYESICIYATRGMCPIDVDNIDFAALEDPVLSTENGATVKVNLRGGIYEKGTSNEYYSFDRSANPIWKTLEVQAERLPLIDNDKRYKALTNELLYLVDEIPLTDNGSKELSFGGSSMTVNKTMEVDSGKVQRFGDMLSYNARLHFFNSRVSIDMSDVETSMKKSSYTSYIDYVVDSEIIRQKVVGFAPSLSGGMCIIPNAAARAIHVIIPSDTGQKRMTYRLSSSKRYNFAYYLTSTIPATESDASFDTTNVVEGNYLTYDEKQSINVTSHYNPIHFPVENSYLFGGEIIAVMPSIVAIASVMNSTSPLSVFTNKGVFALMQGQGEVLYGNTANISSLILDGGVVSTPMGLVFPSAGAIHLLAGNQSVNISAAMVGTPDRGIQGEAFTALAKSVDLYDVSQYISQKDFVDFVRGAKLCFDNLNDEVIISDTEHNYSYVVNMNTKQWHKIDTSYNPTSANCRYVANATGGVTDLSSERTDNHIRLVHLETRPFILDITSSHINRVILYCYALINNDSNLSLSVFASNDLNRWKCVISSTKAIKDTSTYISQIRTNRAAKSWRYFKIVLGGKVYSDSDIANIIIDHKPVIRRNG